LLTEKQRSGIALLRESVNAAFATWVKHSYVFPHLPSGSCEIVCTNATRRIKELNVGCKMHRTYNLADFLASIHWTGVLLPEIRVILFSGVKTLTVISTTCESLTTKFF